MATRQRRKTPLRRALMPILAAAFLTYFGYHAFHGEYGLFARARLDAKQIELTEQLGSLKRKREALHNRVTLLRPESLDPDMIDELARASLNLVHSHEITILRPERRRAAMKNN